METAKPQPKKLLFVYPDLSIGGSTTSFLALLKELDYTKYRVDVAFLTPITEQEKTLLPAEVRVLPPRQQRPLASFSARIEKLIRGITGGGVFQVLYWYFRKYKRISPIYRTAMVNQLLGQINADMSTSLVEEYDVAVAFLEMWATAYVEKKVKAKAKIAFLHINYTGSHFAIELDKKTYDRFDGIACVSPECVASFLSVYPAGKDRTACVENLIDTEGIRTKAKAAADSVFSDYDGFKIVTVGRAQSYTKGIDRIIAAAKELKQNGIDFRWFFIGDGNDLESSKTAALEAGVADVVVFPGAKENPYPYIAGADLFVLPSRHEGKPMVVTEAQILATPVLVTEYASARAQVDDGVDGRVIPNRDEGLAEAVASLISDKEFLERFKATLMEKDFSNTEKIKMFESILEV